jgi:hypothetical protein
MADQEQDKRNADATNASENRRNEILTERLELQRQLAKFESDISSKISKRIQLEATLLENNNSTKEIEKQILKNKQSQALIDNRINSVTDKRVKNAATLISQIKKQIDATTDLGKQEVLYNRLRQLSNIEGAYQLSVLNDQINSLKEENELFGEIYAKSKKLDKGLFSIAGNIVSALPGLGKFSQTFKDAAIESRKAGGGLNGITAGFKKIIELAPQATFAFLVTQVNKADQQATALGRSFGVSKLQARALREEFVKFSANTDDTFVTTDRLVKAQAELSEQLGIAVQFSGEELTTFSKLTEIVGLTAQEAGKLATFSAAAGIETKDYVKQIRASSFAAQQTNKVHFSDKQILQDISKLSAGILVKFQNNPKALAAAVVQTKALGLSLEQVDKAGESLLNFETSIENQLKAQLLTGKQLNLEKARYAALTGDQVTLAQELADQVGSLAEFEEMNVLAQRSLAETFGMSREELADMLLKQEAINENGDKAAKLNAQQLRDQKASGLSLDDYLKKQAEQQSAQEKFNNAITKLQDLIGNLVAGPLGGFIDSLSNGLEYVTKIFGFFGKIGSAIKGFFGDKIGGAMGEIASVATIGALIGLVAKSMTKGTYFNPMIVKEAGSVGDGGADGGSGLGGGIGRIGKAFGKGGMKGGSKAIGRILSKTLKGNALTSLAMGGIEAASSISEGKGAGESIGRALISGITSFGGGALGSLIAPGAGTIGGGILGGIAGDKIGDFLFGDQTPQQVEDGIAPSSKGPFTITDNFGATSITAKGDSIAVSPNVNNSPLDLTPMINAINEVKSAIALLANRPVNSVLNIDGRAIGTAVGRQMETGTSQIINTGYQLA